MPRAASGTQQDPRLLPNLKVDMRVVTAFERLERDLLKLGVEIKPSANYNIGTPIPDHLGPWWGRFYR